MKALFVVLVVLFIPQVALASAYVAGDLVKVSGASPFAAKCGLAGQTGKNYPNSEVEPYVAVNPHNEQNIVAVWQSKGQDNADGKEGIYARKYTIAAMTNVAASSIDESDLALFDFFDPTRDIKRRAPCLDSVCHADRARA